MGVRFKFILLASRNCIRIHRRTSGAATAEQYASRQQGRFAICASVTVKVAVVPPVLLSSAGEPSMRTSSGS